MDMTTNSISDNCNVHEVRIVTGINPVEVETILDMAAASGLFTSDVMLSAEDMAWDSAYGDGNELHTFLKAIINDSGQDRIVGFICYGPIPRWDGNFELYGIAVEPDYQRLGIGSALLSEMNRQVALANGKQIFLETGTDRMFEKARLFYEANSFIQEHHYIKQFVPTDGGVVYCCEIDLDEKDDRYQ